jgi:uracil permease
MPAAKSTAKPVFDITERPPVGYWLPLSLQHLFAMFGATVLVPILTGLNISVALFTAGLGTLIYMTMTGFRVPVFLGSSFAFIAPIVAGQAVAGVEGAMAGAFCAGLIYVVVALLIRQFGVSWLLNLIPPIVVGPVIMVIGLGLASVAIGMATKAAGSDYDVMNLLVAGVTLGCLVVFALALRGFFTVVPVLLAIICGYVFAALVGMVDFARVSEAPLFAVPQFTFFMTSLANGIPWAAIALIAPVALVTMCEHVGDQIVVSRVTGRNFLKDPGLHRTLIGDGLATSVAAFFGGPPNTTYGENIGVLAITRVFSIYVIAGAAVMAIVLAFIGKLAAFIATIPVPVIGGVAIALFGAIAASGMRTLIEGKVDLGEKRNLIIASIILVLGIGGAVVKIGTGFQISAMALAALVGIVLHAVLPGREVGGRTEDILG